MMRAKLLWLVVLSACSGGFSNEEATSHCEAERNEVTSCSFSEGTLEKCVACHEECGDDCVTIIQADPCTFVCPE